MRAVTATDEPYGVFLHVNSVNMQLDAMTITGGRSGIVAEKTTKNLHVTGSTIDSTRVAGIAIGGKGTQIDGLTVKNSRTGVRVERGAGDVTANNVTLIGGDDGLVTSGGSTGVVVKNLTTDGVDNALRNLSSGMQITGGTIRGGRTGMDLQAGTTVNGIQVGLTTTGIRARAAEPIALDGVTVDAVSVGVESQPGTAVTLRDSSVHALEAVRGQVTLLGQHRPQPAAAELPRRDRPAADPAGRDAGGRAPPALAADRADPARAAAPDPGGCGMRRRGKLGRIAAAVAVARWAGGGVLVLAAARPGAPHGAAARHLGPGQALHQGRERRPGAELRREFVVVRVGGRGPGSRHQHDPDHLGHRDHARTAEQGHRQPGRAQGAGAGRVDRGRQHRDQQGRVGHAVPARRELAQAAQRRPELRQR